MRAGVPLGAARVWVATFVLVSALGTTWALTNPVLANPDEPSHTTKAAALVRGQVLPPKRQLPDLGPDSLIRGAFTTDVRVPNSYGRQTIDGPWCYIWDSRVAASCAPAFVDDPTIVDWEAYIGRYPPTYYAVVGWPSLVDTSAKSIYAMRVVSAALNAALIATAFALTRRLTRLRVVPLALLVGMTPQVVQLAGSVNPNGLEVSAGICAWVALGAAVLSRRRQLSNPVLAGVAVSCSLLALTRPLSTLWLAVIGLSVLLVLAEPRMILRRLGERGVRTVIAIVGTATLLGVIWTIFSDNLGNNRGYNPWGLGMVDAVRHSLALSWSYLQQGVAVYGWDRNPSPAPLTWAWGLALALVVGPALARADRRRRIGIVAVTAFVFLVPTILQARTARAIGFVWSGRYGLALFAGISILACIELGSSGALPRRALAWAAAITAAGHVVAHAAAMRRWSVGTDGPLNYLSDPSWHPPVPAGLLLAGVAGAAAALSLLAYRLATEPAGADGAEPDELDEHGEEHGERPGPAPGDEPERLLPAT
ncbi:MAG: DUF2142 domain-containing protein [Acidimicrobiia bacterium]